MNILTKICVVVLLVVVLASCVVFISMATVLPNYKTMYEGEKTRNDGYSQSVRTAELQAKRLQSDLDLANARAAGVSDNADKEISRLKAEVEKLNGEKADLTSRLTGMDTSLKAMAQTQANQNERNATLAKELDDVRADKNAKEAELIKRDTELKKKGDDLDRTEALTNFMKGEIDQLQEQIRTLQTQVAKGSAGTASNNATPGANTGSKEPAPKVNGTVTAVKNEIVEINIGSSKGVKAGMAMMIYREDGSFVAELNIQEVGDSASAGLISKKKLDPMRGDKVQSIDVR